MASKILDIQKQFISHIYNPRDCEILSNINEKEAKELMEIYRNNFFSSLCDILNNIYNKTKNIIGKEKFTLLVERYLQQNKPTSGNLDDYLGDRFEDLIKNEKIKKLAKFEYLLNLSIINAGISDFDCGILTEFSNIKLQNTTLIIHDSVFLFHDVNQIVKENFTILDPKEFLSKQKIKDLNKKIYLNQKQQKEYYLISAATGSGNIFTINYPEWVFIKMLVKESSLGEIYKKLYEILKVEFDLGIFIEKFFPLGIIKGIS